MDQDVSVWDVYLAVQLVRVTQKYKALFIRG